MTFAFYTKRGISMAKEKVLEKLESLFREEMWGRIEPKDIGISRFKILDDLFNAIVSEDIIPEVLETARRHLEKNDESVTAMYLLGLMGYHRGNMTDSIQLKRLIDLFTDNHKWAVVELLAEKILEYGESSAALRGLALSLERLGRSKEAIPVLENLMKIDRFDADVAKKLAFAIIDEDQEKSIYYMKLSIEGFIKSKKFEEITTLWNKLVQVSWEDIPFFDRIERMLIEAKQHEIVGTLLKTLLNKYRDEDHPDQSIELLKKILKYRPDDMQARRDLITFYRVKFGNHSQFEQFLKFSKLSNFKTPVKFAIQDFEKNIVFDTGNFVYHDSWKLGKITAIDNDRITVSFKDKPEHIMSVQMALQSLKPMPKDHIMVMYHEDPETLKALFEEDFIKFFDILIKSYGGKIMLSDIRHEIVPAYLPDKSWAKWWSRARTLIKRDPHYGISDSKKDLFFIRDKPVTFADELLNKFTATESFSERLEAAMEFANNIDKDESLAYVQYFIDYFGEEIKGSSKTRQILSYFILKDMTKFVDPAKLRLDTHREKVIEYLKQSQDIPVLSKKIAAYDYKKELVNLVRESREDWPQIFAELLFETPVRIHKYLVNELIRAHAYNVINNFIDTVITGAKRCPEIFIWVARNLYTAAWEWEWLDYSFASLSIAYFRLMNELKKIEVEGGRLKGLMMEVLFNNKAAVLRRIVQRCEKPLLGKIYDLFSGLSWVEDSHRESLMEMIKEQYADFQKLQAVSDEELDKGMNRLIVTAESFERMKQEYERLTSVEMPALSRELSRVAEISADVRENVEYNALMERQSILELEISKRDEELKTARLLERDTIDPSSVNIGTRVLLRADEGADELDYTILGPWEADYEKRILSYRSPIATTLLGRKAGETVTLRTGDEERLFTIVSIDRY